MLHNKKLQLGILLGLLFVIALLVLGSWHLAGKAASGDALRQAQGDAAPTSSAGQLFRALTTGGSARVDDWELVEEEVQTQISLLDGTEHPAEEIGTVAAVMIENHPASRAQMHGLVEASLVYEAMAEGGITRFLAFFDFADLPKVGPVRSARPYYVDWAGEYGGGYAHIGGSDEALVQLATAPVWHIDEVIGDDTLIFRDAAYRRPHNAFLDLAAFRDWLIAREVAATEPRFDFSGALPETAAPIDLVDIDFSFPEYRVAYGYDPVTQTYLRDMAGQPHRDAAGVQIAPTNLVIQFTPYRALQDEKKHIAYDTVGGGTAWFFSQGQFHRGTWSKPSQYAQTAYVAADGTPVSFAPGQTWIHVVDRQEWVDIARLNAATTQ